MPTRPLARAVLIAASALAVFALWLAVSSASSVGIGFLYLVPVGMTAWWFGRRWGLTVAAGCLALYGIGVAVDGTDHVLLGLLVRAAALIAAALVVAEMQARTARLTEVESELDWLRQALAPAAVPALGGLSVGVSFTPAEHGVSGDFYLLTSGPDGTNLVIVGDVCGHGVAAARVATFARATLATLGANSSDPAEILTLANRTLADRWPRGETFLTAACVVQDPRRELIRCASAGHCPPILLSTLDELGPAAHRDPPLGVEAGHRYRALEVPFAPGDGLFLYTDGLTEARRGNEQFGEARLRATLVEHRDEVVAQFVESVQATLTAFAGDRFRDDVCMVALRAVPLARERAAAP